MTTFLTMLSLFFLCLVLLFTVKGYWERKKLRSKIETTFGIKPSDNIRLHDASLFWEAYKANLPCKDSLDDITWRDLNMDALFANLNSCQSLFGAAWLYIQLRKCCLPPAETQHREKLMGFFAKHDAVRSKVQYHLARLGGNEETQTATSLFGGDVLQKHHLAIYILLAFLPFLPLVFSPLIDFTATVVLCLLAAAVNSVLTLYLRNRPHSSFSIVYSFAATLANASHLAKTLEKATPEIAEEICGLLHSFRYAQPIAAFMYWGELISSMGLVDPFSFFLLPVFCHAYLARLIRSKRREYRQLTELIGEIDLSISILSTRKIYPYYCTPSFGNTKGISFQQLYHPMLSSAVPTSATFRRDILLTGSNASGKSTFIKATAISCITAQALNTCFAKEFHLQPAAILSSMAIQDNILEGNSYFIAELKSMKRITDKAENGGFFYVFIDEILRGTNTSERIIASTSLLRYLSKKSCFVMAATHDLELTERLGEFDNYHFRETVHGNTVHFDYKLHHGPSRTKNALLLMECMQFPKAIIEATSSISPSPSPPQQLP